MVDKKTIKLGTDFLTSDTVFDFSFFPQKYHLQIDNDVKANLKKTRDLLEKYIQSGATIYGVNTGFGLLSNVRIDDQDIEKLQLNLVRSHACGVGAYLSKEQTRALLLIKLHTLCLGYSAVSLEVIDQLFLFLKEDILPAVPQKGSVGASGDLAPLAHLSLPLLGEGRILSSEKNGSVISTKEFLQKKGIRPLRLKAKEGLSLINGTQFTAALSAHGVCLAKFSASAADVAASLSLDGMRGTLLAFDERVHNVRRRNMQISVAKDIRSFFVGGDQIMESHKDCKKVQDPYSFRCVPQVHGAAREIIEFVEKSVNEELNAVTDNPLVFSDGKVISGGNFHAEPLALAMDALCMAVTELGSISERRIEKLTNPVMSDQPAFLTKTPGLESGFMIPHVVAAALCSENKTLSMPACVDSIPTSADKEDHVSMGPISARKALQVAEHVSQILAIEFLAACQALEFLKPLKPAPFLQKIFSKIRVLSPQLTGDQALSDDIENLAHWIRSGELESIVNEYKKNVPQ